MKPDIKICGLTTAEAVDRAVERGASHVGFIFFGKSPRNIEPDIAGKLADPGEGQGEDRGRQPSMLTMTISMRSSALLKPDILQFHGKESPERMLTVKAVTGPADHEGHFPSASPMT